MIERIIPHASAIVLAAESEDFTGPILRTAARLQRKVPVAVLAPDSIGQEWTRLTGVTPSFAAPLSTESVFAALKVVAKEILDNLRKAPQPAAPASPPPAKPWWRFW